MEEVVLVVGGSRGIGAGFVEAFSMRGARVVAASRSLPNAPDGDRGTLRMDVCDEGSLEEAARRLGRSLGDSRLSAIVVTTAVLQDEVAAPEKNLQSIRPAALVHSFIELGRRLKDLVVLALHPGTVATDLSAPFASRFRHTVFSVGESVSIG